MEQRYIKPAQSRHDLKQVSVRLRDGLAYRVDVRVYLVNAGVVFRPETPEQRNQVAAAVEV